MSSAILYLAIVAIWACVLVPRWLRRPHEQPSEPETAFEPGQPEAESGQFADGDPVAWEDPAAGGVEGPVAATYSVTATYSAEVMYSTEGATGEVAADTCDDPPARRYVTYDYDMADDHGDGVAGGYGEGAAGGYGDGMAGGYGEDMPGGYGDGVPAGYGSDMAGGYRGGLADQGWADDGVADDGVADDGVAGCGVANGGHPAGYLPPEVPQRPPGPPRHILQARRRTLTMMILITVVVMGSAFLGLTPWWTAVAPFVMLGMYLMLLREAARADAEHVRRRAETHARAVRAARRSELARERDREAHAVSPPQPTAEVINLSALAATADDQPYDQYADAKIRAVGD